MWDAHKTALRLLVRGRTGETGWMGDGIIYSVFCSRSRSVVRLVGVGLDLDATVKGRGGYGHSAAAPLILQIPPGRAQIGGILI